MNKLKLYLSRILAFLLLLSIVAAPVSATAPGESSQGPNLLSSEVPQPIYQNFLPTLDQLEWSVSDLPGMTCSEIFPAYIPPSLIPTPGNTPNRLFTILRNNIIYNVPVDQEYTVSNNVLGQDFTISLVTVECKSASKIRAEYDYLPFEEDLPEGDPQIYFATHTMKTAYFLTEENVFEKGLSSERDPRIRRVRYGETVTFTLPEAEEGQHYRLIIAGGELPLIMQIDLLINSIPEVSVASPFSDVPETAYFAAPVAWAVEKEITTGTTETTFAPNDTCTKAQILTFLWRAKGQIEPTIDNPFSDVTEENYYYKAALWAYENGLLEGDIFDGSVPCTRAMTVTYLWKLAGRPTASAACGFTDVDSGAEYAQAVAWCVEQGITTGTGDTTFSPDNICTRGQIVTFLYRALAE